MGHNLHFPRACLLNLLQTNKKCLYFCVYYRTFPLATSNVGILLNNAHFWHSINYQQYLIVLIKVLFELLNAYNPHYLLRRLDAK